MRRSKTQIAIIYARKLFNHKRVTIQWYERFLKRFGLTKKVM